MMFLFPFWFTWLHGVMVGMAVSGGKYHTRIKDDRLARENRVDRPHTKLLEYHTRIKDDRLARVIEKNRHRLID